MDVGWDPTIPLLDVRVPVIHFITGGERDRIEDVLLTSHSPPPRNEGGARETRTWEDVDDRFD